MAVMTVVPPASAVTLPSPSTLATEASRLSQMMVLFVASAGLTVAISVSLAPLAKDSSVLLSSTEETSTTFLLTVTLQEAFFPPAEAVISVLPSATAVTSPPLETVATEGLADDQRIFLSVASDGITVAVICTVSPMTNSAEGRLMVTDDTGTSSSCPPQAAKSPSRENREQT